MPTPIVSVTASTAVCAPKRLVSAGDADRVLASSDVSALEEQRRRGRREPAR